MNNFLGVIYLALCVVIPVALLLAAIDVVKRPEHLPAIYKQWQEMRHDDANSDCVMRSLQASDEALYWKLCMQQKGFDS